MNSHNGLATQRGLSETTQWSLVAPLVLVCILISIQLSVWTHGSNAAHNAAIAAAEYGAILPSSDGEIHQVALQIVARDLSDIEIGIVQTSEDLTVTVAGRTQTIIPGKWNLVQAKARRFKEA